jgi:xanthine dehydrogenase accessory factor
MRALAVADANPKVGSTFRRGGADPRPKIDDGAPAALTGVSIGALGSRKTHARRLERLTAAGASETALGTIRAPIGVRIGAQSPAEIAVAILAEVIAALRSRGAKAQEAAA